MKLQKSIFYIAVVASCMLYGFVSQQAQAVNMRIVTTLAELKTITGSFDQEQVRMACRQYAGDNAGGIFVWWAGSTDAADDALTVLPNGGGGRWKRAYTGYISPSWFGALGNGTDDHVAVQAAFDRPEPVKFDKNYYVDAPVRIGGDCKNVDFNGYMLIGIATTTQRDAVLEITGHSVRLNNAFVHAAFANYKCGVHWFSVDLYHPSAFCRIMGLRIDGAIIGLQYGVFTGQTPLDAPMSENNIYNLTGRSVEQFIRMNQPNGFLFISNSTLDVCQYEWAIYTTYHTWNPSASKCIDIADSNQLFHISQSRFIKPDDGGYVFSGPMSITDCDIQSPAKWFQITGGDLNLLNCTGNHTSASYGVIEVIGNVTGTCRMTGCKFTRYIAPPATPIQQYANLDFITALDASNYRFWVTECCISDWRRHQFYKTANPSSVALVDVTNTEFPTEDQELNEKLYVRRFADGTTTNIGTGTPEGVVVAVPGSQYIRTDGGTNTSFYVKQSGTGNTGWGAK